MAGRKLMKFGMDDAIGDNSIVTLCAFVQSVMPTRWFLEVVRWTDDAITDAIQRVRLMRMRNTNLTSSNPTQRFHNWLSFGRIKTAEWLDGN
jgi:hypothetical protein